MLIHTSNMFFIGFRNRHLQKRNLVQNCVHGSLRVMRDMKCTQSIFLWEIVMNILSWHIKRWEMKSKIKASLPSQQELRAARQLSPTSISEGVVSVTWQEEQQMKTATPAVAVRAGSPALAVCVLSTPPCLSILRPTPQNSWEMHGGGPPSAASCPPSWWTSPNKVSITKVSIAEISITWSSIIRVKSKKYYWGQYCQGQYYQNQYYQGQCYQDQYC